MKAADIQVGMVIDKPDSRGYKVTKIRNPGIPNYTSLFLINTQDHHDRPTLMVPVTDEIGVIG
jgi:hypothetical protein